MGCRQETSFRIKPKFITAVLAGLYSVVPLAHAGALPSGGQFVGGTGTINGSDNALTINQTSDRGVIDWKSFSIGAGSQVSINNGTGATLNRVTGGNMSVISGTLSATGSLYLINPQGIVVGKSGVISTGGRFVASTLDTNDDGFMMGDVAPRLIGSSNAWIVNLGKIGSTNGDVFLIATNEIDNLGSVSAPNGTAEFVVGKRIRLMDSSSGRQAFVELGSAGKVVNEGMIDAAQINLQAADGNIYALSGNHEAIRATGTATRDGHIWLVAGNVTLAGDLNAANANGHGGTVDTVARNLVFCECGPTVSAALWNITTPGLMIGDGAALSFSRSLTAGTWVNVQTTGAFNHHGDIEVAADIGWSGAASLKLNAYRSVNVDKGVTIKNQGSGGLALRADATSIDNGGSVLNSGTVDWSKSTGLVNAFYDINGSYSPGTLLSNASWTTTPWTGLVTQITGYKLVNSLADLENVSNDLASNYALSTNIDATATNDGSYVPIGSDSTPFTGQFDGRGYSVRSLNVVGQNAPELGLFGDLGMSAVVRNLTVGGRVSESMPNGAQSLTGNEGILAGLNEGTIVGVTTYGSIDQPGSSKDNPFEDDTRAGGLVGMNYGTILRSSSSAGVTFGGVSGGGLIGENHGSMDESYATGTVIADGFNLNAHIGGLIGSSSQGAIERSYATGATINLGNVVAAGGLVGENYGSSMIGEAFATGAVASAMVPKMGYVVGGGIAGFNDGAISLNAYWNMDTTGAPHVVAANDFPYGSTGGQGLKTAQMSMPSSFAGWNFGPDGAWAMPAGATHPVLAWQLLP
ncbi:two-partner secretion domain-containing protein [Trinickia sp.]|uniref:two-partner secretion domain-containing protein n=1 Tax=Trinickia sp. TaxID=2571163 RepID=UPI003F7DB19E